LGNCPPPFKQRLRGCQPFLTTLFDAYLIITSSD
jgi:hypothetical protein